MAKEKAKFIVFEEYDSRKNYDLTIKVCDTLSEAVDVAKYHFERGNEDIFIADYDAYMSGSYDYVKEYRH